MAPYDAETNPQSQYTNSTQETDALFLCSSYSRLTRHSDDTRPIRSSTNASTSFASSTRNDGNSVPLIYRDADGISVQHNYPSRTLPASFSFEVDQNDTQKKLGSGVNFNASRYPQTQIANSNTHSSMKAGRTRNLHNLPRFSHTEASLPVHQPHARVSLPANSIMMRTIPVPKPIHTSQPTPTRSISLLSCTRPTENVNITPHRSRSSEDPTGHGSSEQVCLYCCCLDCDGEDCRAVGKILGWTCIVLVSLIIA
ncbi:hypothetical protein BJ165DRAFT_1428013 [Panaeolus papilionaceus]|nr:hypothetical protein BJ165DRAFT_1428013 [Panaeolus papilionaceus]